jgi:hypothetical protein
VGLNLMTSSRAIGHAMRLYETDVSKMIMMMMMMMMTEVVFETSVHTDT